MTSDSSARVQIVRGSFPKISLPIETYFKRQTWSYFWTRQTSTFDRILEETWRTKFALYGFSDGFRAERIEKRESGSKKVVEQLCARPFSTSAERNLRTTYRFVASQPSAIADGVVERTATYISRDSRVPRRPCFRPLHR